MKKILLWDPRFPARAPDRLTLADDLASAIVRSGVGCAADPAEQGALANGAPVDASGLVLVTLQHGPTLSGLRRVWLPLAVAQVAIAAGTAAPIGAPIATSPALPTVTLSASISKAEGSSGANLYTYIVTLSAPAPAGGVLVPWSFLPGTTSADDFTGSSYPAGGNIAIAAGNSSGSFSVSVNGDAVIEGDEIFTVLISTPAGYIAGAATSATGTILNDDASTLTPYTLNSRTQSVAATAAGATMTANRLNRHNRMMNRLDAAGITGKLKGLYILGDTEAQWLINHANPSRPMTKTGSPTYTAGSGASAFSGTAYYDTGYTLAELSSATFCMGGRFSGTATASALGDMGWLDGTGGLTFLSYGTASVPVARLFGTAYTATGATAGYAGNGWIGFGRADASNARDTRNGSTVSTGANTYVASTSTGTVKVGWNGSGSASTRTISCAYLADGLSAADERELFAAVTDYLWGVIHGDVFIYPMGVGPATVNAQKVIYGLTPAGLAAAYQAKRRGLTVALVGSWNDRTIWDVGGMVSSGLNWVDVKDATRTGGIFRDMLSYANGVAGTTNANTQAAMSPEPRYWQAAVRHMLDAARTGTTNIPGLDIPIYMTGGINGVTKSGNSISSIATVDGRTFTGAMFMDATDEGDLIYYSGVPRTSGYEAKGTGAEAVGGYSTTYTDKTFGGSLRAISPYVTAGTASSGLLPDIIPVPGLASGAAEPVLQAMNYRLTFSALATRQAPIDTTAPPNFNAARYETLARACAAATASSSTVTAAALIAPQPLQSGTAIYDVNNGSSLFSTDLPQSGGAFLNAGIDYAARRAVLSDLRDYDRGYFYAIRYSGDARFAPAATAIASYGLDPLSYLDPGPFGALWWPNQGYRRDPSYRLQNTGALGSGVAILNATDLNGADGTTPRNNGTVKTGTLVNYPYDVHDRRRVDDGGVVKSQGSYNDTSSGGADQVTPVPMEVLMPDKASCPNLLCPVAPSTTGLVNSAYRMEPQRAQAGEFLAEVAYQAITNSLAVQDVDYATVRTALLSNADVVKMQLPQVN